MKLNDQYILKQIRKGDIKSFESLFHKFYPGMVLYSLSILKNKSESEEVVQDVFYNIWKNRNEFLLKTSWQSYLYKSVYNNSLMLLRKSNRKQLIEEDAIKNLEGSEKDPSEEIDLKLLNNAISKTLELLPERTREIFNMSRFEGMKYKEIALQLSISIKTVEANMAKALKAFRMSLKNYGY
ncbi:MAG: RNA polymerase sigma-70 factor [Bacteroidales bacterium]|nr:RNA polymerase sigma-70 factor [Bacteroidales bacterium]MCF8390876.1 RNA polymerase sigma-70 factor [Bacteroidales bacterium]